MVLIDYGYASKYLNKDGVHYNKKSMDNFKGNMLFSGLDGLNFIHPSRRSDIHSIGYLIIYMLNNLEMPLFNYKSCSD